MFMFSLRVHYHGVPLVRYLALIPSIPPERGIYHKTVPLASVKSGDNWGEIIVASLASSRTKNTHH